MAEGSELQPDDEGLSGGAVKSFLEHLEDLRWVLIKSAAATLVAMFACLYAAPQLIKIVKWPLSQAAHRHIMFLSDSTNQYVTIQFGSTRLQSFVVASNHFGGLDLGTNRHVVLDMAPIQMGTQTVLSLKAMPATDDTDSGAAQLSYLDPSEPFLSTIHMAFFGGLIIASPFVLYYIGQFVMPALKIKEKKYFLRAFAVGVVLFFMGVSVAFFIVMPAALKFAQVYAAYLGVNVPFWTFSSYVKFVGVMTLGMGLGFELPVVLLALVKIGVLDYEKLSKMRRYMVVANLVLGALLTTPEVFTQIVMAVALQLLFEVAVWIAWYWEQREKKAQKS